MNKLKTNIFFKIGMILLLILVLLIPTSMVKGLIDERENVQKGAIEEISEKWATGQTIAGPFLSIPYDKYIKKTSKKNAITTYVKVKDFIHVLPKKLNISGSINPEKRYRGIYEVVVYESDLKISGEFGNIDIDKLDIDRENIHFDKATINFGISDLKGIENQISINWNDTKIDFNSGLSNLDIVSTGINAPIDISKSLDNINSFESEIILKGSQHIYFMPFGKK